MTDLLLAEIKALVGVHLGVHNVNEKHRLLEDLGAESADLANIIASVEEKYRIRVKESEIARLITPQDIYTLVLKYLNGI